MSGYAEGGYVEGDGPLVGDGDYMFLKPGEMVLSQKTIDAMAKIIARLTAKPEDPEEEK